MNNPWNDELRACLLRWLMEFGDDWVSYEARRNNHWWWEHIDVPVAVARNVDTYYKCHEPVVFEGDSKVDAGDGTHKLSVRLNERALAFLKGESDETN